MSAMQVVNATETLINSLALSLAASGRPEPVGGSSQRAINAVRKLASELKRERAVRTALQAENAELRKVMEDLLAQTMKLRAALAERR